MVEVARERGHCSCGKAVRSCWDNVGAFAMHGDAGAGGAGLYVVVGGVAWKTPARAWKPSLRKSPTNSLKVDRGWDWDRYVRQGLPPAARSYEYAPTALRPALQARKAATASLFDAVDSRQPAARPARVFDRWEGFVVHRFEGAGQLLVPRAEVRCTGDPVRPAEGQ